ncbi:MAG: hypothetical protein KGH63_00185 [Candidatus Micrarchaeota archaeon]|nr:hypothetical protein [Candidatus Micrarchaeota archaeon]
MNVQLLNHHVLRCIGCGRVQMSTARERVKCFSCGRSWALCQKGQTVGVLDSFWLSTQASAAARMWKARIEPAPSF